MSTQHFTDKQKCAFWIPPFGDIKEISKRIIGFLAAYLNSPTGSCLLINEITINF